MNRILITIHEVDLKVIDSYCKSERYSRSEFLVDSALAQIKSQRFVDKSETSEVPTIIKNPKEAKVVSQKVAEEKGFSLCKHGSMLGLCKFGCV